MKGGTPKRLLPSIYTYTSRSDPYLQVRFTPMGCPNMPATLNMWAGYVICMLDGFDHYALTASQHSNKLINIPSIVIGLFKLTFKCILIWPNLIQSKNKPKILILIWESKNLQHKLVLLNGISVNLVIYSELLTN